MEKLVSLREFARIRGVSLMAVQKAIKSGRISPVIDGEGNKKIDVEQASQDWDDFTDPSKVRNDEEAGRPSGSTNGRPQISAFQMAKAKKQRYEARLARLKYKEKAGKLVDAAKVRLEAFRAARLTRDIILNIPNKISHELAAETDAAKIHIFLTDELTKALDELAAEGRRRMSEKERGKEE